MPAPLEGIKVLDFTRYQQGPFATVMLADMGADVIKVEERRNGDLGRALGAQPDGFCGYFEAHNRNKRSITLDVRTEKGKQIVRRLAERVDVVVENFRPGVMDRLGIGYADLKAVNPRIIMASASGYGMRGPDAKKPSFDIIGQAVGGIMVSQGGGPENEPQMVTAGFADHVGAMFLAFGVAMALIARDRFGIGQHLDASLLGGQIAFQAMGYCRSLQNGVHSSFVAGGNPLFRAYGCADGKWLAIGILDPKVWPSLTAALDRPDLEHDQRFAVPFARHDNAHELTGHLAEIFRTRPRDEWLKLLEQHDVAAGPVRDHVEAAEDPQVLANEYIVTVEHPHIGPIRVPGIPVNFSETPGSVRTAAPELGQHTEEVLLELGYTWEEMGQLREEEII